jgi:hypothetical protein
MKYFEGTIYLKLRGDALADSIEKDLKDCLDAGFLLKEESFVLHPFKETAEVRFERAKLFKERAEKKKRG